MNAPRPSAEQIITGLGLEPLIPEGGWFRRIWYRREGVSLIYYLLREGDFSEFHSLTRPEHYLFLMGDPVELYWGLPGSGRLERTLLGQDILGDQHLSLLIEPGTVQGSRLVPGGEWALLSTVMNPPFEPEIYRTVPRDELLDAFPAGGAIIRELSKNGFPTVYPARRI